MMKFRKQTGLWVLLTAALISACSSGEEMQNTTESGPQTKVWVLSIKANKDDNAATRGVHFVGGVLKSKWGDPSTSTGQTVEVYRGETKLGELTASASEDGSTLITGEIEDTDFVKDETLKLYSPSKARDYSGQTGTIESMSSKDYVEAEITVEAIDADNGILRTTDATFTRLQSFNKITFTESVSSVTISATGLVGTPLTVDHTSATDTYYVALANTTGASQEYTFASGDLEGSVSANIQNGYYYTPASITLEAPVTYEIEMNPLWYVAPYNMTNSATGSSATLTMAAEDDEGHFYRWADAMSTFAAQTIGYNVYKTAGKNVGGVNYHLPIQSEYWSIVPGINVSNIWDYVSSSNTTAYKSDYITPIWGYNSTTKAGVSETSWFRYVSSNELHAIRFLGTDYCSAWKWEWSSGMLTISATLIGSVTNSADGANNWYESHWSSVTWGNNDSKGAVQRSFYARGWASSTTATANAAAGSLGYYWSASDSGNGSTYSTHAFYMQFRNGSASVPNASMTEGYSVRLFRDN